MSRLDNRTDDERPQYAQAGHYVCITCSMSFHVEPRKVFPGDTNPTQTLFCITCMSVLKSCINREKTKDFGW
jgi:hypothetical protein